MAEPKFSVYIGSLGRMATAMDGAADAFREVASYANGPARVATDALGFIGRACQWPEKYKAACDNVNRKALQAGTSFDKAASELIEIEKEYIADDDYYAKKFGLLADGKYPEVPDPKANDPRSPLQPPQPQQPQQPRPPQQPPRQPQQPIQI